MAIYREELNRRYYPNQQLKDQLMVDHHNHPAAAHDQRNQED